MTEPTAAPLRDGLVERLLELAKRPYPVGEEVVGSVEKVDRVVEFHMLVRGMLREAAAALAKRNDRIPPREPTLEMTAAAPNMFPFRKTEHERKAMIWRAMYDAAPTGIPR
jgi:hypothetical protein